MKLSTSRQIMGTNRQPFAELMALEAIKTPNFPEGVRYRSLSPAYSPGNTGSSYGGHQFAQAAWAAAQTVDDGFILHVGEPRFFCFRIYLPLTGKCKQPSFAAVRILLSSAKVTYVRRNLQ